MTKPPNIIDASSRFERQPLTCSACKQPIEKGESFRELKAPTGEDTPVHDRCLRVRTK